MRHKSAFKQFAKDCKQHFNKRDLLCPIEEDIDCVSIFESEKSTRNSKIRNRF